MLLLLLQINTLLATLDLYPQVTLELDDGMLEEDIWDMEDEALDMIDEVMQLYDGSDSWCEVYVNITLTGRTWSYSLADYCTLLLEEQECEHSHAMLKQEWAAPQPEEELTEDIIPKVEIVITHVMLPHQITSPTISRPQCSVMLQAVQYGPVAMLPQSRVFDRGR